MKKTNDQTKCLIRDCFFVRQGERRERCFYSEILYVEASGCYCYIYRRDKPRLLIAHPLLMLGPFLPEDRFKRVHRSYIVNLYEVTYSGAYPFTFRQPIKHKIAFKSTILYPFIP